MRKNSSNVRISIDHETLVLSEAQATGIYPGLGNPDFAFGSKTTLRVLADLNLIVPVSEVSPNGSREAQLTETGYKARKALLEASQCHPTMAKSEYGPLSVKSLKGILQAHENRRTISERSHRIG